MASAGNAVRAWTFTTAGYPDALKLSTIAPPRPDAVGPNHILVKIHAAGLNPVDIQIMNLFKWMSSFQFRDAGEKTLCSDFSGTIIAAGSDTGFAKGDEVFGVTLASTAPCGGTMSEVAHIDLANASVVKKPAQFTHVQAAGLALVWITAMTCRESVRAAVERSKTKKVAVLGGSSSTGMYCVHLCKAAGWTVLATCSGRNAEFVRGMGAAEIVDYTQTAVRSAVQSFQPDAIIDCVGGTETHGIAKRYVTIVGDKTSRTDMGGPMTYYWTPTLWLRWFAGRLGLAEEYDNVMLDLTKGYLDSAQDLPAEKIVTDSVFAFTQVKEAYERLNTGRARGKVIVEIVPSA